MDSTYTINRFPPSTNRSLMAWSSADTHILKLLEEEVQPTSTVTIINDRFGYLSVQLSKYAPVILSHTKSQEDAIQHNLDTNKIHIENLSLSQLLDEVKGQSDFVIMKIPKSMDLFHLFLMKAHAVAKPNTKIYCGFMTRHFTKQMISIASTFFENVEQSLAWKKSRIITLSSPKQDVVASPPIKSIPFVDHRGEQHIFEQYYGVFSANHIDYATQFLLENLKVSPSILRALDLASGNGVIAHELRIQSDDLEIHLMDDSHLAIESSKLNLKTGNNHFHYAYSLDRFEDQFFDLIICNPPFHFEHENTNEIALQLFSGAARVLKEEGQFILVANLHLNYKTQLSNMFKSTEVLNMNSKFEIIRCEN